MWPFSGKPVAPANPTPSINLQKLAEPKPEPKMAFFYRYAVYYKKNDGVSTFNWRSRLFSSHNMAETEKNKTIKDINDLVQAALDGSYVCIIDASIHKSSFVRATATDVKMLKISDSNASEYQVFIRDGNDLVIPDSNLITHYYERST